MPTCLLPLIPPLSVDCCLFSVVCSPLDIPLFFRKKFKGMSFVAKQTRDTPFLMSMDARQSSSSLTVCVPFHPSLSNSNDAVFGRKKRHQTISTAADHRDV